MPPTIAEIRKALDYLVDLQAGVNDVERIAADPQLAPLRDLTLVQLRCPPRVQVEERVYYLVEEIDKATQEMEAGAIVGVIRRLLGFDDLRSAGKKLRFGEAREFAKHNALSGDMVKTVRPQAVDALARQLQRMEYRALRSRLRYTVGSRMSERLQFHLDNTRAHLTHLTADLPLLPTRANVHRRPPAMGGTNVDVDALLTDWLNADGSNLAVLLGSFGSGKTSSLVRLAEHLTERGQSDMRIPLYINFKDIIPRHIAGRQEPRSGAINQLAGEYFIPALNLADTTEQLLAHLGELVIIFDGFDEVWGQLGASPPDLRHLARILQPQSKILLGCRRSFAMRGDALIQQLTEPAGYAELGIVEPLIMELESPRLEDLRHAFSIAPSLEGSRVVKYLESFPEGEIDHLFRPLLLQMLLLIPDLVPRHGSPIKEESENKPLSVEELYRRYVTVVLARDFNQNNSAIPGQTKRRALMHIAGDLFDRSGTPRNDDQAPRRVLRRNVVALRIMEAVSETRGLDVTERDRDWTNDFLQTSHLLAQRSWRRYSQEEEYEFVHQTFCEFFAAEHLLSRLERHEAFGLASSPHNEGLFDSLILYFIKAELADAAAGKELLESLRALAGRRRLDDLDRLLCIYLLEDEPDVEDILAAAPLSYHEFLRQAEDQVEGFFLRKVIKYQLILLEGSLDRALSYVELLRTEENATHRDLEEHVFSTELSVEDFLLRRLRNPRLKAAIPVTIYRLGQFGSSKAQNHLLAMRQSGPPNVRSLVEEALAAIAERSEERP